MKKEQPKLKYLFLLLIAIAIITGGKAQNKNKTMTNETIATAIFSAWQKGESGNGYSDFRRFMNESRFRHFSHPLSAVYYGKEGFNKLADLIKSREAKPNQLRFTNILRYQNGSKFCFQFDSEGKVGDGFDYKGYNIIQLEIENDQLIGFREYFGYIDPSWFK